MVKIELNHFRNNLLGYAISVVSKGILLTVICPYGNLVVMDETTYLKLKSDLD